MARGLTLPVLAEMSAPAPSQASSSGAEGPVGIRRGDFEAFSGVPGILAERLGAEPRVVLVAGEGEGKRAAGICLATIAVASGQRVALLECDLAAPMLAASLGLAAGPGLSEYLRREAKAEDILQTVDLTGPVVPDALDRAPRLVVVVGGVPAPDAEDPLAAADFAHAVSKLRGAYDLVVLDGPSVDAGRTLVRAAGQADTVLVCVSRSRASGRHARNLEAALAGLRPPAAGVVLVDG